MPKTTKPVEKKKSAPPPKAEKGNGKTKPKASPKPVSGEPKIEFPTREVHKLFAENGKQIIAAHAKKMIGWTEVGDSEDYDLIDRYGKRIRLTRNAHNRAFDMPRAEKICQNILCRLWEINLETIIISLYGNVTSGQHRLVAIILAWQDWQRGGDRWKKFWETEPYIESLVATGGSEDPKVLRTIDDVKPRGIADVFYTLGIFGKGTTKDAQTKMSKAMEHACRFVFSRTGCGGDSFTPYLTNSDVAHFADNHPHLVESARVIYELNKKLPGGKQGMVDQFVPPGLSSGLLYLMAGSASDGDDYRNTKDGSVFDRCEDKMDFSRWEMATDFWREFCKGIKGKLKEVQLAEIPDSAGSYRNKIRYAPVFAPGSSRLIVQGSRDQKIGVLVKAWNLWAAGEKITADKLSLEHAFQYNDDDSIREIILVDTPCMAGIDLPPKKKEFRQSSDPSPDQIEASKKKIHVDADRVKKREELLKRRKNGDESPPSTGGQLRDSIEHCEALYPDRLLIFRAGKNYRIYGRTAEEVKDILELEMSQSDGLDCLFFAADLFDKSVATLQESGYQPALCTPSGDSPGEYMVNLLSSSEDIEESEDSDENE